MVYRRIAPTAVAPFLAVFWLAAQSGRLSAAVIAVLVIGAALFTTRSSTSALLQFQNRYNPEHRVLADLISIVLGLTIAIYTVFEIAQGSDEIRTAIKLDFAAVVLISVLRCVLLAAGRRS